MSIPNYNQYKSCNYVQISNNIASLRFIAQCSRCVTTDQQRKEHRVLHTLLLNALQLSHYWLLQTEYVPRT
jgi:hypothetical protein